MRGGVCEGTFLRGHDVPCFKVSVKFFLADIDNVVTTPQTIVCGFLCEQEREGERGGEREGEREGERDSEQRRHT